MIKRLAIALFVLAASAAPAFAHLDPAEHGSFMAGVSHPLFGARPHSGDGRRRPLGGAAWRRGRRSALWLVPSAFVGAMAVGFAAALAGLGPALRRAGDPRLRRRASACSPPSRCSVPAAAGHGDGRLLRLLPWLRAWRRDRLGRRAVLRPRLCPFDRAAACCWASEPALASAGSSPADRRAAGSRASPAWLAALGGSGCGWRLIA